MIKTLSKTGAAIVALFLALAFAAVAIPAKAHAANSGGAWCANDIVTVNNEHTALTLNVGDGRGPIGGGYPYDHVCIGGAVADAIGTGALQTVTTIASITVTGDSSWFLGANGENVDTLISGLFGPLLATVTSAPATATFDLTGDINAAQATEVFDAVGGFNLGGISSIDFDVAGTVDLSTLPGGFGTTDITIGATKIIVADGTDVAAVFGDHLAAGTVVVDTDGFLLAEIGNGGQVNVATPEHKAIYWAENTTKSKIKTSDLTNVRIDLDPAIFDSKIGTKVYVGVYSAFNKLGDFTVQGTIGHPYIDGINASVLAAGRHIFAIYSDSAYTDLLDAVYGTVTPQSVEKPVADTAAGFGVAGGLAILVALIGAAGVATARRKRA